MPASGSGHSQTLHHPDAVAGSVEAYAADLHSWPVAEIHAFQFEPVRLVGWRREVGLVVVGSEIEPVVLDPGLLALLLGHPVDDADHPGGIGLGLCAAGAFRRHLAFEAAHLAGVVDQVDRAIAAFGDLAPFLHDHVLRGVVVLGEFVARDEGVDDQDVDLLVDDFRDECVDHRPHDHGATISG